MIELQVNTKTGRHPISPLIYGVNAQITACDDPNARFTLCRLGGNPWSTYNWENNASNAGKPNCSQNDGALSSSDEPAAPIVSLLGDAHTADASALVTVPVLDYVAADKDPGSPAPACSGDVHNTEDYLTTRFKANHPTNPGGISAQPDTSDNAVYEDEFVSFVKDHAGTTNVLFALDNQPELWDFTHPAVHPVKPTYDEVVDQNAAYASAIRSVWPTAEISGYVGYGVAGFLGLQDSPERAQKGDFIDYYLASMRTKSNTLAHPLIDYLDVHWYPEFYFRPADTSTDIRVIEDDVSPEMIQARVQLPRSLWDPSYTEATWVPDVWGGPVQLVPWLEERIQQNFSGLKLAISEWTYGGENHISGGIAAADALGVFGREGVDLAAFQQNNAHAAFVIGAFAAYRNYDGEGSTFGDTSVRADSSDIAKVSVYGSYDAANPERVVIVAINRTDMPQVTALSINHDSNFKRADVYVLTEEAPLPAPADPIDADDDSVFRSELPAYSVSVIVPKP